MKMVVGPGVPLWVCWVEEVGVIELIDLVQIMGYPPKIVMLFKMFLHFSQFFLESQ
jgi:hypothetical protein